MFSEKQDRKTMHIFGGLSVMLIFGMVVCFGVCCYLTMTCAVTEAEEIIKTYGWTKQALDAAKVNDGILAMIFIDSLYIIFVVGSLTLREAFGTIIVDENYLILKTPMRRKIKLRLSEIKYFGIDYGVYSGGRHFWIYFSTVPIPKKSIHAIQRLKYSKNTLKIEYSEREFNFLVDNTPMYISKQLRSSYSVIRLFQNKKA